MAYRHTKSEAVYGQIGYDLSSLLSGLKLNAGIRRTTDKPSLCSTATPAGQPLRTEADCKRSEEHTSELQSLMRISYAVFCLKKKNKQHTNTQLTRPRSQ